MHPYFFFEDDLFDVFFIGADFFAGFGLEADFAGVVFFAVGATVSLCGFSAFFSVLCSSLT